MTSQSSVKTVARLPETGWSRARRLRGECALRTCLPAVEDERVPLTTESGPERNIVRGED
ncbi:hypothetical protein F7R91_36295 [Streptomyces luteolifulvus]|uniref:Uncharacterized protein n=1 Tax=Streptomyces luteolifulvus TaxID=2615112 RepID=A0A6H9UQB1_9ACTN|nr:hypothetical protein [Streptomyces luteolifulvus]KAB1140381.1 hypothetical protein F7R91_36295 [Streptomyces luteolifulvus]